MNLNICIDTKDLVLQQRIQQSLEQSFSNINYMSYESFHEPIIFFKDIHSIKEFHSKTYPMNTVILIIDNPELLFLSLDYQPLGFIRKDQFDKDIQNVIHLIIKICQNLESILTLKISQTYIQLKSSHIIYIESYGHYLTIHTMNGEYRIREKISDILNRLSVDFKRIHKSIIVNTEYIKQKDGQEVILHDGKRLPIGRKYKF